MKTDNALLRICNRNIKEILKHTLSALVFGSLILSCAAASLRVSAAPEQSENGSSLSEDPIEETDPSPVEAITEFKKVLGELHPAQ